MCDYLLEPVKVEEADKKEEGKEEAEKPDNEKVSKRSSLVIFAVDISGSMSTTTTVPGLQG